MTLICRRCFLWQMVSLILLLCRSEPEGGLPCPSDEPQLQLLEDEQDSAWDTGGDMQSVHTEPELQETTKSQAHPGLAGGQAHEARPSLLDGGAPTSGVSGGPPSEKTNDTKTEGNSPSPVVPPSSLTFDPSQVSGPVVAEPPENHTAGGHASPQSWAVKSEPHQTKSSPPSLPSADLLPTFTSQRPPDLPTAASKRAPSNCRNISNSCLQEQRYVTESGADYNVISLIH